MEVGKHIDCDNIFTRVMFCIRIGMGMNYCDTIYDVSVRKQGNPADVPDEQQRKETMYEIIPQSSHQMLKFRKL